MATSNGIGLMFTGSMISATGRGMKTETRRVSASSNGRPHAAVSAAMGSPLWTREELKVTRSGLEWAADGVEFWRADASAIGDAKVLWWEGKGGGKADGEPRIIEAMYQPWWCSRFHMTLRGIKVQRLQDINVTECRDEGLIDWTVPGMDRKRWGVPGADGRPEAGAGGIGWPIAEFMDTPQAAYAKLWDSLHGAEGGSSWKDNPTVVAIVWDAVEAMYPRLSPASEVHRWGSWP